MFHVLLGSFATVVVVELGFSWVSASGLCRFLNDWQRFEEDVLEASENKKFAMINRAVSVDALRSRRNMFVQWAVVLPTFTLIPFHAYLFGWFISVGSAVGWFTFLINYVFGSLMDDLLVVLTYLAISQGFVLVSHIVVSVRYKPD